MHDCSPEQLDVLAQFKKWITDNKITENPWHDDVFFLKFCRARKFDLEKMIEMFTNYMEYRKENDLDHIIHVSHLFYDNFSFINRIVRVLNLSK